MQAVILAGGFGTRLGELVKERPKPMMLINGKPFLEYLVLYMTRIGISKFILCTGYKHESISQHFGDGSQLNASIQYSVEKEPLGTGGAMKNSLSLLDDVFLLLNGDTLTFFNLENFRQFHEYHNSCSVLTIYSTDSSRYGSIISDENGLIKKFNEKNPSHFGSSLINAGVYLVTKKNIPWNDFADKFSLETDLFPHLVNEKKLYSYVTTGYFRDIGTLSDLEKFKTEASSLNL